MTSVSTAGSAARETSSHRWPRCWTMVLMADCGADCFNNGKAFGPKERGQQEERSEHDRHSKWTRTPHSFKKENVIETAFC